MITMRKAITKNTVVAKKVAKTTTMSARPGTVAGKRYSIVNRNSGKTRRGAETRAEARSFKKENERIWDNVKSAYVR